MEAVGVLGGIKYGFKHMLYGIGVVLIGLIFMGIGFSSADGGSVGAAVIFGLIGVSIVMAGSAGVTYKVIADAVATGNAYANRHSSSGQGSRTARKIKE